MAAAVLSFAAARRRLRHLGLQEHQSVLWADGRFQGLHPRGAPARYPRNHRADHQSYLGPASLVPARASRETRLAATRLLPMERYRPKVPGNPHHLCRRREIQLGMGPGGAGLLLASFLCSPARSELRQSAGVQSRCRRDAVLARSRGRRHAPRRRAISDRAGGHDQREPARDPRAIAATAPRARHALRPSPAARRGQSMAGGCAAVFRRRRRMPHGIPLPADAAHLHGGSDRRPSPYCGHHAADAGYSGDMPVGGVPAQP